MVDPVERHRELGDVASLLDRADAGSGGVLGLPGHPALGGRRWPTLPSNTLAIAGSRLLAVLAGRAITGPTVVVVTSRTPLGIGAELWLDPLSPAGIGMVTREHGPEVRHALCVVSPGGEPGDRRDLSASAPGRTAGAGRLGVERRDAPVAEVTSGAQVTNAALVAGEIHGTVGGPS